MSVFSDYIKATNTLVQLEASKVRLSYEISSKRKQADDRGRIKANVANEAYDLYLKLQAIDLKIQEVKSNKDDIRHRIRNFMQSEFQDILVIDNFEVLDDDEKSATRSVVFAIKQERNMSTPENVAFNDMRERLTIHLEGDTMEL